jgi:uncharacterized surface protein with fasciclin (FAS1) repeats
VKCTPARRGIPLTAVLGLLVVLTGCATPAGSGTSAAATTSAAPETPAAEAAAQPSSEVPFGTGCGDIPAAGEGSITGMADDPVGTAVANNPAVRALADAIGAAHLVGPFDSQREVTVLAPANAAFAAVPRASLGRLMADTPRLTALLTHHVIQGRLTPDRLAGTHTTLNNDRVTVDVSPEAFSVAAEGTLLGAAPAVVVCGNLQTANATVYLIDQVLTPSAS